MTEKMPTAYQSNTIEKKRAMISAMEQCLGIVKDATKIADVTYQAHQKWMKEDNDYAYEIKLIQEHCIDLVELKLFELIRGVNRQVVTNKGDIVVIKEPPHAGAVMFYLKTKAKHRGYVERTEITGDEGRPIIHIAANI